MHCERLSCCTDKVHFYVFEICNQNERNGEILFTKTVAFSLRGELFITLSKVGNPSVISSIDNALLH